MSSAKTIGGMTLAEACSYWAPENDQYMQDDLTIEDLRKDLSEWSVIISGLNDELNRWSRKDATDAGSDLARLCDILRRVGVLTT